MLTAKDALILSKKNQKTQAIETLNKIEERIKQAAESGETHITILDSDPLYYLIMRDWNIIRKKLKDLGYKAKAQGDSMCCIAYLFWISINWEK